MKLMAWFILVQSTKYHCFNGTPSTFTNSNTYYLMAYPLAINKSRTNPWDLETNQEKKKKGAAMLMEEQQLLHCSTRHSDLHAHETVCSSALGPFKRMG